MSDYRGTPEYAAGYVDGIHGRPKQPRYLADAVYEKAYQAGLKAISVPIRRPDLFHFFP